MYEGEIPVYKITCIVFWKVNTNEKLFPKLDSNMNVCILLALLGHLQLSKACCRIKAREYCHFIFFTGLFPVTQSSSLNFSVRMLPFYSPSDVSNFWKSLNEFRNYFFWLFIVLRRKKTHRHILLLKILTYLFYERRFKFTLNMLHSQMCVLQHV